MNLKVANLALHEDQHLHALRYSATGVVKVESKWAIHETHLDGMRAA